MKKQKTTAEQVHEFYLKSRQLLNGRECDVVERYYAFGDHRRHTLQEIGTLYKITRERVRQIKSAALIKIGAA